MHPTFKTFVLMTALSVLLIIAGNALGGQRGAMIALVFALVMNVGSYWFSDKVVLSMYRASELTEHDQPRLFAIIHRLTTKAELPMPRVYLIPQNTPNAFATGRDPAHAAVAVTSGIMQLLDERELEGVLAHELAHVKNRDILIMTIAATLAGAITMLATIARWGMIFGGLGGRDDDDGGGLAALVMLILAPLAAMLIQMAISRSQEYKADAIGARISGQPLGLASALQRLGEYSRRIPMQNPNPATAHMFIINPLRGKGITKLFSTHPPLAERIERLRRLAGSS